MMAGRWSRRVPHKIALNFEDGITQFIDADESESIADAAYRQGINVPLDCTNGVCGTCKAFRQSGEFDPGSYIEDALSDAERVEGYVLCCQAKPQSDMVIDILASSGACKVKPKDTMAEIVEVEALSAHRIRLSVKPLEGALPMFLPGQYVNLTAPNETASLMKSPQSCNFSCLRRLVRHIVSQHRQRRHKVAVARGAKRRAPLARPILETYVPSRWSHAPATPPRRRRSSEPPDDPLHIRVLR